MNKNIVSKLKEICGEGFVIDNKENIKSYLYDETEYNIRPQANEDCIIVKPRSEEEISEILKFANDVKIPVIARGGGTGLCGAVVPTQPSIIISMERFKKVIDLDEDNSFITVEAGVTLAEMNEYLSQNSRLYFPCHPGDESAHMAGLVVQNAGGARAIKHGVMRNHIKGIRLVLPTGEIMSFGGKIVKNNAGYDIMHLIIGSEGTLGIVTQATIKIYPKENFTSTLLFSFEDVESAVKSVVKILQEGIVPLAAEYLDRDISLSAANHLGLNWPLKKGKVDIMFILTATRENQLYDMVEKIESICSKRGALEGFIAESTTEQSDLIKIRSNTYTSVKETIMDTLDIAIPVASMPDLMKKFEEIASEYNAVINTVGHIGDGNVHNNIYLVNSKKPEYYDEMRDRLFKFAVENGGTITAEHGIGKTRKSSMKIQFSEEQLQLMKRIKIAFDPNNILNPGTGIV